jgi:hypothetical protein
MGFAKSVLASGVLSLALSAPAWASFVIHPTYDSTITSDANASTIEATIQSAIDNYQTAFIDPFTANITFGEGGGLGQSSSFSEDVLYSTYRGALIVDATSADDAAAIASIPTVTQFNSLFPSAGGMINVNTATIRAVCAGHPGCGLNGNVPSDGSILLKTSITFPGSPGTTGTYSLMSVAEHEIDEVLGLGSVLPSTTVPRPEDVFRYTSTPGVRSFDTSSVAFFSIDGTNDLAQFHLRGSDMGDFGDWETGQGPGGSAPRVQDWSATPFVTPVLGVELRALDVIGYTNAPEPGTWGLFAIALAGFGGYRASRRFREHSR